MTTVTTKRCMVCHQTSEIQVPDEALAAYQAGAFIQNAWPEATPDQREMLLTGTHPACWDAFAPEDED